MAGCFGGGEDSLDAPDEELDDWNVHFAATAADLPTCDEDTNGRLYYVEADNQFQVCKTSGWEVIAIQGADGLLTVQMEPMVKMVQMDKTALQVLTVQMEPMVKMVQMDRTALQVQMVKMVLLFKSMLKHQHV